MPLLCHRVRVLFPREKVRLEHQGPAWMRWTEHGGTLILLVGDLNFGEIAAPGEESGFFLEVKLTSPETLIPEIESFAAAHHFTLTPGATPPPACLVRPILAACHLPGLQKFIFAEDSRLEAASLTAGMVDLTVQGAFRARPLPCREADLVIHLAAADLAQLLSYLLALARKAQ